MGDDSQALEGNALYKFGPFTLDPEDRLLTREGRPVALAPRVFDTLLILAMNAGRLVRKSEIMSFVWPEARVEDVNLAHNISDLRRILGVAAIQTVPKHGYRFVEEVRKVPRNAPAPEPVRPLPPPARASARMVFQLALAVVVLAGAAVFLLSRPVGPTGHSSAPHVQAIQAKLDTNLQALQHYLQGRYFLNRRNSQDFKRAEELFRQAIAIDPNYAQAYAGLAEALAFGSKPMNQIQSALDHALSLDPDLAEAHALVGLNAMNGEWDWVKAEREFRRAIQLNPSLVEAHQWYGDFLGYMGRFDQSAGELNAAIALEPLSSILWSDKCEMLTLASRFTEAISACRYVLQIQPDYFIAHYQLVQAYIMNRQPREALETAQAAVQEDHRAIAVARLAEAYAANGNRARSVGLLEELAAHGDDRAMPFEIASCYALLGEREKTLDWLEKGHATGAALMIGLKMNPVFAPLRTEPRFRALLNSMRLNS
jgi:DNA-binding winged helix-turn-helix (wHTH) protein/tetratricopeptide (TPR) repeat protein